MDGKMRQLREFRQKRKRIKRNRKGNDKKIKERQQMFRSKKCKNAQYCIGYNKYQNNRNKNQQQKNNQNLTYNVFNLVQYNLLATLDSFFQNHLFGKSQQQKIYDLNNAIMFLIQRKQYQQNMLNYQNYHIQRQFSSSAFSSTQYIDINQYNNVKFQKYSSQSDQLQNDQQNQEDYNQKKCQRLLDAWDYQQKIDKQIELKLSQDNQCTNLQKNNLKSNISTLENSSELNQSNSSNLKQSNFNTPVAYTQAQQFNQGHKLQHIHQSSSQIELKCQFQQILNIKSLFGSQLFEKVQYIKENDLK